MTRAQALDFLILFVEAAIAVCLLGIAALCLWFAFSPQPVHLLADPPKVGTLRVKGKARYLPARSWRWVVRESDFSVRRGDRIHVTQGEAQLSTVSGTNHRLPTGTVFWVGEGGGWRSDRDSVRWPVLAVKAQGLQALDERLKALTERASRLEAKAREALKPYQSLSSENAPQIAAKKRTAGVSRRSAASGNEVPPQTPQGYAVEVATDKRFENIVLSTLTRSAACPSTGLAPGLYYCRLTPSGGGQQKVLPLRVK